MFTLNQLSDMAYNRDYESISNARREMVLARMKLDKFFTMFLDKFGGKMEQDKTDTPIWKLYNAKLDEYSELERSIVSSNYYLNRK